MKIARNNMRSRQSKTEMLQEAKEAEAAGDFDRAKAYYEKIVRIDPHHEGALNRLMIIYRKQKESAKELDTVRKAIGAFEDMYDSTARKARNKKVSNLSNAFLKTTGLADKKGKLVHLPEPLAKWTRRKAAIEKKLKKKK